MNDLHLLRHESYEAAGEFHRAQGECFSALSRNGCSNIREAAEKADAAGKVYKASLEGLIDSLDQPSRSVSFQDELLKTGHLVEALERELSVLAPYRKS